MPPASRLTRPLCMLLRVQTCEMDTPRILVTDKKIGNMNELVPVLEGLVKSKEPLLIIADDVTGEALSSLVLNKMRGVLDICAIKSPGFGDRRRGYLEDIAVMTGATFVTEQLGLTLEQVTMPTQCGAQFNAQFLRNPCAIF